MRIKAAFLWLSVVVSVVVLGVSVPNAWAVFVDTEKVSSSWDGEHWLIMPLRIEDHRQYLQAHQSSASYLYRVLGWGWPTLKISPEVNAEMVRFHAQQHDARESFTYVVRARGSREITGAIYVNPVNQERRHVPDFDANDYQAEVSMWFRQADEKHEFVEFLLPEILLWLEQEWNFRRVLIPVHEEYSFLTTQFAELDYRAFTFDGDTHEHLYRYP